MDILKLILVSISALFVGCGLVAKVSPTCASAAIAQCHSSIDACFVDNNKDSNHNNDDLDDRNSK
jgi:hypothetical protein